MPSEHYKRVKEFMQKAGQDVPSKVEIPDIDTRKLRASLILEEALETISALGFEVNVPEGRLSILRSEFELAFPCHLMGVADGCADMSVVAMGTLIAFGIDDEALLKEVDESNLRKFGEGSYRREDGKWMKPPGWDGPDVLAVIESH